MRKGKLVHYLFLVLFLTGSWQLIAGSCYAQGQAGQAAPFLYFGVGAKALSMGGAFAGLANDATAGYWNPAGLTQLKQDEISTMHTELFLDIKYDYIGYAHLLKGASDKGQESSETLPLDPGPLAQTLALSLLRLDAGTQEARDQFKNVTGIISANDFALLLSYGQKFKNFSLGGNVKYIQQKIGGADGTGYALDLGLLYPLNWRLGTGNGQLGLTLQNLIATDIDWSTGAKDDLPIIYRLGGAYTLPLAPNLLTLTLDLEQVQHQDDMIFHLGGEYALFSKPAANSQQLTANGVALRLGLDDENFTAGLGVTYDQYTIDYAFVTHEELGNKHRISVGARF